MGKSIQIKDPASGDSLYPITKPELVQDDKGNTVMELFPVQEGKVETSAVVKGGRNQTTNFYEFACGKYNQSVESSNNQPNGTLFSVGAGTSSADRKNAIEVKQNGDVYILIDETPCKVEMITDDEIKLSCASAVGRANDVISAPIIGEPVEIGFNNRYMLDALKNTDTDELKIIINGSVSPIVIKPVKGDSFLNLVLPMRFSHEN